MTAVFCCAGRRDLCTVSGQMQDSFTPTHLFMSSDSNSCLQIQNLNDELLIENFREENIVASSDSDVEAMRTIITSEDLSSFTPEADFASEELVQESNRADQVTSFISNTFSTRSSQAVRVKSMSFALPRVHVAYESSPTSLSPLSRLPPLLLAR